MIKRAIILGAGASSAEGAPLQKELFKYFFDEYNKNNSDICNFFQTKHALISDFFKDFWGIDITDQNSIFPTFEDCLGVLDLAESRNECFKGYCHEKILEIKDFLILIICKILEFKLRETNNNHDNLVNNLKNADKLRETVFISLNYDIVIDNVLSELYEDYHLDYGIPLVNYELSDGWRTPDPSKSIFLLKLHGSLNWLFCPTCNHILLTPAQKSAIYALMGNKRCKTCGGEMESIIIPPTYFKDFSNIFLHRIFSMVDEILRNLEEIVICGYSFPDADLNIKYLIKRAEMSKNTSIKVYVINDYDKKPADEKISEEKRFACFLKTKQLFYTDLSFKDFCDNPFIFD